MITFCYLLIRNWVRWLRDSRWFLSALATTLVPDENYIVGWINAESGKGRVQLLQVLVYKLFLCVLFSYVNNYLCVYVNSFFRLINKIWRRNKTCMQSSILFSDILPIFAAAWTVFVPERCITDACTELMRAQELCENRGGRPGLPTLISLRFLWT